MNQGWIKLHRKLLDNPLWTEKREFSRAECWIDILMNVQHTDEVQEVLIKNKLIECSRGESVKSLETWASRWGMSKSKARRVLNLFQSMNMIVLEDVRVSTRLRVLQFSEYNDSWNGNETEMKRKRNGNETRLNPDKNVKKVKNERMKEDIESNDSRASGDSLNKSKKDSVNFDSWPEMPSDQILKDWKTMRVKLKAPITQTAVDRIGKQLELAISQGHTVNDCLATAIERGWKGFSAGWMDKTKTKDAYSSTDW